MSGHGHAHRLASAVSGLVVETREQHLLIARGEIRKPTPHRTEHDPVLGGHCHISCVRMVGQFVIAEPGASPPKVDRQPTADDRRPSEEIVGVVIRNASADGASCRLLNDLVDVVMLHAPTAEHRGQPGGHFRPDEFEIICKHRAG